PSLTLLRGARLPKNLIAGMGSVVSLPLLDAMVPALSAGALKTTPRLGFIYIANGVIQDQWIPKTVGRSFELPAILKPLEPVRSHVNVLSGLSHLQADTFGDGTGDHPRSSAVRLSGVHAYDRSRPDIEVRLATSADQLAARVIGRTTQVPSIEMIVDPPTQGACDTSDCFFQNTISWHNATTPDPAEVHPRQTGQHLAYKLDTPMSNLLVTVLNKAGVNVEKIGVEKIGDSTGPLDV
ncbi:MAG: DUF1552 domain-containing protein, partial [Terriglobia bacterium]